MSRQLRRTAAALLAGAMLFSDAAAADGTWQAVVHVATSERRLDFAAVELLRDTAAEMVKRSPTFVDLLKQLGNTPHVRLTARPVVERYVLGRGIFAVQAGITTGYIEVSLNRLEPRLGVRAIAHELGHAAEVACLPRQDDTRTLQALLRERSAAGRMAGAHTIETPFAIAVERAVLGEFCRPRGAVSQFAALATAHGLPGCSGVAAGQ